MFCKKLIMCGFSRYKGDPSDIETDIFLTDIIVTVGLFHQG